MLELYIWKLHDGICSGPNGQKKTSSIRPTQAELLVENPQLPQPPLFFHLSPHGKVRQAVRLGNAQWLFGLYGPHLKVILGVASTLKPLYITVHKSMGQGAWGSHLASILV